MFDDIFPADVGSAADFSFGFSIGLPDSIEPDVIAMPGTIEAIFPPIIDMIAAPEAQDDSAATVQNEAITLSVLDNDVAAASGALQLLAHSDAGNGTVSLSNDGTLTYTPDADFVGVDSFNYTVFDGFQFDEATVTINVEGEDAHECAHNGGDSTGFALTGVNDWYNPAWGGGFIATYQYTVSDASIIGDDLYAWAVDSGYTGNGVVVNVWANGFNGSTNNGTDGSYDIGNVGIDYQPELQVGDTLSVSFQLDGAGFNEADFHPTFSDCDPVPFDASASDVEIDAAPTNDWGSGFLQNVEINNLTEEEIGGWSVILSVPEDDTFNFNSVWGATAETLDNGDILFSNLPWNEDISANGSVSFGFTGDNEIAEAVVINDADFLWV